MKQIMKWHEARAIYPDRWLVIEALEMHLQSDRQLKLDEVAVLDMCDDGGKGSGAKVTLRCQAAI